MPQLSLLALVAGLFTGLVILVFRIAIEYILGNWLLSDGSESFETLSYLERFAFPVIGAAILGISLTRLAVEHRRVGVVHVMERLSRHQGFLPARNAVVQFFAGIIALVSGQSGGREGPAVHLGAASSSLLGQAFKLPNNSIRTLVACGSAAAIASSFNTPIAGVIFAMEVIMMDYTIGSFIPVIIAAVSSTLLTHFLLGSDPAFVVAPLQMHSLLEIPFIIFTGVVVGCIAAAFITLVQVFSRLSHWPFYLRMMLAGSITAGVAIFVPEVMGVGYDTVNGAMLGQLAWMTLGLVVIFKVLTSAAAVGLGLPVGLIGPAFVIGAAIGGVLGHLGAYLQPAESASVGFYVMLGMAAMMASVLQAPLAALLAVMELTANPNLILPAMLVIVIASLITQVVFEKKSVFLSTLETLGLQYPPNPVTLHLQRAGVAAIMNRAIVRLSERCSPDDATAALKVNPRWVVVETGPGEIHCVLNAADLNAHLEGLAEGLPEGPSMQADPGVEIDLLQIPALRMNISSIDYRATVAQAQESLEDEGVEALCVRRTTAPMIETVVGVITQDDIDNYRDVQT